MTFEQKKETAAKILSLLDGLPIWCANAVLEEASSMVHRSAFIDRQYLDAEVHPIHPNNNADKSLQPSA